MNRFRHALLRVHPFFTLVECLGILLAYQLGVRVSGRIDAVSALAGSILACTSCVVVMQQSGVRESLREGGLRLLGTLIGVVIGCVYLLIFRFNVWGLLAAIFLQEVVCMLLAIPNNGKMATISLVVVMLVSHFSPDLSPVLNGLLRFTEAAVGASIGIVAVWLLHLPERLRNGTGNILPTPQRPPLSLCASEIRRPKILKSRRRRHGIAKPRCKTRWNKTRRHATLPRRKRGRTNRHEERRNRSVISVIVLPAPTR